MRSDRGVSIGVFVLTLALSTQASAQKEDNTDKFRRGTAPRFSRCRPTPTRRGASWELFYRFQLSRFIGLTSDIQYIIDPSGLASSADTLVATFRFELSVGSDSF